MVDGLLQTFADGLEDFQELAADRVAKGFSLIQIVAGLYPDMEPFDERGANEAGFPWDREFTRINPAYFDLADLRLAHRGAVRVWFPCIFGLLGLLSSTLPGRRRSRSIGAT